MARPSLATINSVIRKSNEFNKGVTSSASDEAGNPIGGPVFYDELTPEQYAKMSDEEAWAAIASPGKTFQGRGAGGYYYGDDRYRLEEDDPLASQFAEKFGSKEFDNAEMGNEKLTGLIHGKGDIKLYGKDASEWMQDPSRVLRLDDGSWVIEAGNLKGDALANYQSEDAESGLGDAKSWALAAAAMFAGGYGLGEAGLLGGETGTGAAWAEGGGFGAGGISPEAAAGTGLTEGAAGTGTLGTVSTDGAALGPTLTTGPEAGIVEGVTSGAAPAAAAPPPAGWSLPAWNSLSPGAQRVILSGLSTGASAMVNTRNAERAIEAANNRQQDQQDFETETRQRRGQAPTAVATVRPRAMPGGFAASGGLADKYMTRRGG